MSLLLVIVAAVLSVCTLGTATHYHTDGLKKELESTNSQIKTVKGKIAKLHDTIERKGRDFRADINALTRGHDSKSQEWKRMTQEYLNLGNELSETQMQNEETVYKITVAKKNLKRVMLVLKWVTQDVENLQRRKVNGDPEVCQQMALDLESKRDASKISLRSFESDATTFYILNLKLQQAKTTLYKLMKEEEDLKTRIKAYENQHKIDAAALNAVIKNKKDNLGGIKKGIAGLKNRIDDIKYNLKYKKTELETTVGKLTRQVAELTRVKARKRGFQHQILCYKLLETESTDKS